MFGGSRRHRPAAQPLTRETADPNAATAAASAFLRKEPSTSLSSAAAAAALKARPTTPTNVATVQSKRALRRSASVSSTGSRDRGMRELRRVPSSGSMTERTFRSPSPARSSPPESINVPPVPSIPDHDEFRQSTAAPAHKRATSLQMQPFRTGSQRLKDGHGSWFGAATTGDISNMRHSDDILNLSPSSDLRPSSPSSSINFSYPRSRLESPSGLGRSNSTASDHTMVYDANSRRMVPRGELFMRELSIRDASERPVRKKKHAVDRSGSHLARGTVSRLKGTAVDDQHQEPIRTTAYPPPQTEMATRLQTVPETSQTLEPPSKLSRERTLVEEQHLEPEELRKADLRVSDGATVVAPTKVAPEVPLQGKQDTSSDSSESEEELEIPEKYRTSAVPQTDLEHPVDTTPVKSSSPIRTEFKEQPSPAEQEPKNPSPQGDEPPKPAAAKQYGSVRRTRVHSESPHRTTHFAPAADKLLVRHEPPPRSLSPRKSALKRRSPTRTATPSESGSEISAVGFGQDDAAAAAARKKAVRVSFDESNIAVGDATTSPEVDSPALSSPQARRPWHTMVGRYKRDSASPDDDEIMTPRPALPSFGSIREKKPREPEERPLVRPSQKSTAGVLGQSSDFAIGSIIAQEQASKHEANTSRYREPLPPVVTSVEGSGYTSNSSLSSGDEDEDDEKDASQKPALTSPSGTGTRAPLNGSTIEAKDFADPKLANRQPLPKISVSHPSPRVDDDQSESPQDFFDVPGGFPDTPEGSDASKTPPMQEVDETPPMPERDDSTQTLTSSRPEPRSALALDTTLLPTARAPIHDIQEETEESEGSSIYSDAYEDLSDMEGDGFISLAAVVDSPVEPKLVTKAFEKTIAKSKEKPPSKESTPTKSEFQTKVELQEPLKTQDDWENAKAYWRSLSADKRRQLELEAAEEAGDDADIDEAPIEPKKMRQSSAKSKPSEAPSTPEKARHPDRTYQIQPGTSWSPNTTPSPSSKQVDIVKTSGSRLRKPMRGEQPSEAIAVQTALTQRGSMRKSMRSGGSQAPVSSEGSGIHFRKSLRSESEDSAASRTGMRKSLRTNGPATAGPEHRASLKKEARPLSYQPPSTSPQPAQIHRRNQSADAGGSSPVTPTLRRRGSDSSESSFKRMRASSDGMGFRRTMRGSMREPPAPASDGGRASSRFSLRSLSPAGSGFRRSSGAMSPPPTMAGGLMRQSMRGDLGDGSTSRKRVSGFGRSAGKRDKKSKGSRFAASSDEDDDRPAFHSRFLDSSDDDEDISVRRPKTNGGLPRTLRNRDSNSAAAAAMGLPATSHRAEDASGLSDSEEEMVRTVMNTIMNGNGHGHGNGHAITSVSRNGSTLKRSGSGRDSLGAAHHTAEPIPAAAASSSSSPIARPPRTRRGSFMSILRRKRDPAGKISRDVSESAARRDTRLERSAEQLALIRSNSSSHRLQKRAPSWPLPEDDDDEDTYVDEEKRPSTAAGTTAAKSIDPESSSKPGLLGHRSASHSAIRSSYDAAAAATATATATATTTAPATAPADFPKKKKFSALRKMFGLHD